MKAVAGRLRIDLAQYRALEAFAKFGSDLDKSTLAELRRGARLVELLKQGQYLPMPVEKQVVAIYAGTNGYLDEIPAGEVGRCEQEFLNMMDLKHADFLLEIARTKQLTDDITARLKDILASFMATFKNSLKK
jgi:F-type H+-transporting ATPase subunit alpha